MKNINKAYKIIQNYINEYLNYGFDYTGDDNMSADEKIETY